MFDSHSDLLFWLKMVTFLIVVLVGMAWLILRVIWQELAALRTTLDSLCNAHNAHVKEQATGAESQTKALRTLTNRTDPGRLKKTIYAAMGWWLPLVLVLCGCHTGKLGEDCNPDGTCSAGLTCQPVGIGGTGSRIMECYPAQPVSPPPPCQGEADCFCHNCLQRCGAAGIKLCAYADPTVWGSKGAACECRTFGSGRDQ